MDRQEKYGFCSKCGAVTQNGVCQSCGHGKIKAQWAAGDSDSYTEPVRKKKRSQKGLLTFLLCFFAAVILLCVIMFFSVSRLAGSLEIEPVPEYKSGDYGYNIPYSDEPESGSYVPDKDDEYYVEIADATRLDLSYQILWQSVSTHADDPDDTRMFDCVYPILTGENASDYAVVNRKIQEMACAYQGVYQDYDYGVVSYGYVTYMDEEKISVVVQHTLEGEEIYIPLLDAVTFRLDTGKEIPQSQMQEVDDELVRFFRARDTQQNGTVPFVEGLSDEELKKYLSDQEKCVMFYTPVGLEIGFNYDGGWVTVTIKDDTV